MKTSFDGMQVTKRYTGPTAFSKEIELDGEKLLVEYRTDRSAIRFTNKETGKESYVPLEAYIRDQNCFDLWIEAYLSGVKGIAVTYNNG